MSREIKFRAWHGGKLYYHVEMTTYSDGSNCCTMIGDDKDSMISPDYDYITPIQSTGLTDCKGEEIYEGDILTSAITYFETDHDIEKDGAVVVWNDKLLTFCLSKNSRQIPLNSWLNGWDSTVFQIAGSIHQTP